MADQRVTIDAGMTMTPKQLAIIERAKRTPARIVEIERTRRGTAYRNMLKRYSAKAALERELERLVGRVGRIEWRGVGFGRRPSCRGGLGNE
jgi:hypothetical protein